VVTKTIHDNVLKPNKFVEIKLLISFLGIFISYLIFGIVQESMYKKTILFIKKNNSFFLLE
jgi:hypothetical protein